MGGRRWGRKAAAPFKKKKKQKTLIFQKLHAEDKQGEGEAVGMGSVWGAAMPKPLCG